MSRWCRSSSIIPGELWTRRDYGPWNSFQGRKKLKSSGGRGRYKQPGWRHPKQAEIWPLTSWRTIIFISPNSQRSRWLWVSGLWKRVARRLMTCLKRSFTVRHFCPFSLFACRQKWDLHFDLCDTLKPSKSPQGWKWLDIVLLCSSCSSSNTAVHDLRKMF